MPNTKPKATTATAANQQDQFDALRLSLNNVYEAIEALPDARPWLANLGHLAVDLTALGCTVRIEIIVHTDVPRMMPLDPPEVPSSAVAAP